MISKKLMAHGKEKKVKSEVLFKTFLKPLKTDSASLKRKV